MRAAFVILIVLGYASLCAQAPAFTNYNQSNGLPSNETYYVSQDEDGFVWILTDNGVVKFDGSKGELFNKKSGLADNVNFSVHKDPKNRLWFRSYSGALSYYSKGVIKNFAHNDVLQHLLGKHMISSLVVDKYDSLHLTISSGVFVHMDTLGHYKLISYPEKSLIIEQFDDSDPSITYDVDLGFIEHLIIRGQVWNVALQHYLTLTGHVRAIELKGKLFFSFDRYFFLATKQGIELFFTSDKPIISLSKDNNRGVWIGLQAGGVIYFDGNEIKVPKSLKNLNDLSVTSVMRDRYARLWVSTLEKGVFYFPNLSILNYSYPFNSKLSAVTYSNREVFLGNYDGSLYKFSPENDSFTFIKQFSSPITSVYLIEKSNIILVSTAAETYSFDLATNSMKPVRKVHKVRGIKKFQSYGDEIIGGNFTGVFRFDKKGNYKNFSYTPLRIRLFYLRDSAYYVSPVSGLIKSNFQLTSFDTIHDLSNNKVLDIKEFKGRLLVATAESEIFELDDQTLKPFFEKEELPCKLVREIMVKDDNLYLATECGLIIYDLRNSENHSGLKAIVDESSGLMSKSVDFVAFAQGKLLSLSPDGISVVDTANLSAKDNEKFYFKDILINNESVQDVQSSLPYFKNSIEFRYGFISFSNRNIRVKHRLSPKFLWTDGNDSDLGYFSLSPGLYEPEIMYSVNGGPWKIQKLSKPFEIELPWWQNIYFKGVVIIIIAAIMGLVFFIFYQRKITGLNYQAGLKMEKDRISQELHDNIGSKLAYIKFSLSSLNTVIDFQNKKGKVEREISSVVDELRDTIWAINKEEVSITDFVDRVRLMLSRIDLHGRLIDFAFINTTPNQDSNLAPGVAVELFRIIQEAINNSIKHSGGDKIIVELCLKPLNDLFVSIKDNGLGFDENKLLRKDGYGLSSMKRRADKLGANFKLNSSPETGTEISVTYRLTA